MNGIRPLIERARQRTYSITSRICLSSNTSNDHTSLTRPRYCLSTGSIPGRCYLRSTERETGKFLIEDLREDGTAAIKLSFINEVLSRLEEEKPSKFPEGVFKNDKKEPKVDDIAIPSQMRRWAASLSGLTAFLEPGRKMANISTNEMAIAQKKDPPYAAFVTPKPHERPWCVDLPSHERHNKARKESVPHKSKDSPQQVSIQAWLLYMLRFVVVGDLLDAWSSFGGLSAQLSHLSIALHLATVGNVTLSIMYDSEVRAQIQRLARLRDEDTDFERLLTEENAEIKQRLKNDWGETRAKKAADKASKGDKGKNKGGKEGSEGKGTDHSQTGKGRKGKQ